MCYRFVLVSISLFMLVVFDSSCAPTQPKQATQVAVVVEQPLKGSEYLIDIEKKLRDQIQPAGVSFVRTEQDLLLIVQCNLLFETDKFDFRFDAAKVIDPLAKILTTYPPVAVDIKSYTDSTGPLSWNQRLSEYRANSLFEFLKDAGINAEKIRAAGFGPQNPIESNSSELGRQANRRLEVRISPPQ